MELLFKMLWIGVGGFLGAISRYILSFAMHKLIGSYVFPYGTLTVNILGCFFAGLIGSITGTRLLYHPNIRVFLLIGILGSFTTFSSFGFETLELFKEGSYLLASINISSSIFFCLLGVWLGNISARLF